MMPRNSHVTIEYLERELALAEQRAGILRVMLELRRMNSKTPLVTALKYGINDCQCAAEFDGSGYELL